MSNKSKSNSKNPEILLERLTKTVSAAFPIDATRPSVLVAFLDAATMKPAPEGFERNDTYYASVVRWVDGTKTVVAKARAKTLAGALEALAVDFDRTMDDPDRYIWEPIVTFTRVDAMRPLPRNVEIVHVDLSAPSPPRPPPPRNESFWAGDGDFDNHTADTAVDFYPDFDDDF